MFSKEENKQIKVDFYTQLGKKMKMNIPLSGEKVKWMNFRTGIKDIYIKVEITKRQAFALIEFKHQEDSIRELFYDQLEEFKVILNSTMPSEGVWFREFFNDYGDPYSKVEWVLEDVSIFKKETWETAHNFLSEHLIALDEFWADVKPVFKDLND